MKTKVNGGHIGQLGDLALEKDQVFSPSRFDDAGEGNEQDGDSAGQAIPFR